MNKTFAALAIAGLSFSPVAQAATKTYLKSVINNDDLKASAVWQVTIDLAKLTAGTEKDDLKGTYKKISLSTGKASGSKATLTKIEELMGGVALDEADEVTSFPSDTASVFMLVAQREGDMAIKNALAKADAAAVTKRQAAEKKVEAASKASESAADALENLRVQVNATQADYGLALANISDNGAGDLADAIIAVYAAESRLNKDEPGLNSNGVWVVKRSAATELIELKADLAKAKKEKRSTEALDRQIEDATKASADAKKELDDLKKDLKAAQDTFNKELSNTDLTPEQVKGTKASIISLGKFRATWLGYASKLKKAIDLEEKTIDALASAQEALASIQNEEWKVTHSFLSVSQSGSAASTKSVVAVLQRPGGKAVTYNGPGYTAAGNVFAIGASGYVVGFDGAARTVNGYPVLNEASGTAASNFSTGDVSTSLVAAADEDGAPPTALAEDTIIYKVVNGKVLTYKTKLDPDGTEAYVIGDQVANKIALKLGLLSGQFGKDAVVGVVGTFADAPRAYSNQNQYVEYIAP